MVLPVRGGIEILPEPRRFRQQILPRIAQGGLDAEFYAIYVSAQYYGKEDFASKDALWKAAKSAAPTLGQLR